MKLTRLMVLASLATACGAPVTAGLNDGTTSPARASEIPVQPGKPVVLAAAGDIAAGGSGDAQTAALIERLRPTKVLTLGDNQYPDGAYQDFLSEYDPSWGLFLPKTLPTPGNHDCYTSACAGYFRYFGAAAGTGRYAVVLGRWLIISANSAGDVVAEAEFVRTTLADDAHTCQLVAWHHPRWSSGKHGSQAFTDPLWRASTAGGADVVLNGHDHVYERFALLNDTGGTVGGRTREFVVGTGGASHYSLGTPLPGSERQIEGVFGVLQMELQASSYSWSFHSTGGTILDEGSTSCR